MKEHKDYTIGNRTNNDDENKFDYGDDIDSADSSDDNDDDGN